jgi:hypothetical protein
MALTGTTPLDRQAHLRHKLLYLAMYCKLLVVVVLVMLVVVVALVAFLLLHLNQYLLHQQLLLAQVVLQMQMALIHNLPHLQFQLVVVQTEPRVHLMEHLVVLVVAVLAQTQVRHLELAEQELVGKATQVEMVLLQPTVQVAVAVQVGLGKPQQTVLAVLVVLEQIQLLTGVRYLLY